MFCKYKMMYVFCKYLMRIFNSLFSTKKKKTKNETKICQNIISILSCFFFSRIHHYRSSFNFSILIDSFIQWLICFWYIRRKKKNFFLIKNGKKMMMMMILGLSRMDEINICTKYEFFFSFSFENHYFWFDERNFIYLFFIYKKKKDKKRRWRREISFLRLYFHKKNKQLSIFW